MRSKISLFLLTVALLSCMVCAALAENNAQLISFTSATERVKLRAEPAENARVLGQYYGGQPLEVLETGGQWCRVRLGGRTGYVMKKFLTELQADTPLTVPTCVIRYPETDGMLPLYAEPSTLAQVLTRMRPGVVRVLATVSEAWLHLRYEAADGQSYEGFAQSEAIAWPGTQAVAADGGGKLHLREKASKSSASLGLFFSGSCVDTLVEDTAVKGWTRVRIGNEVGYMLTSQLSPVAGMPSLVPPLGRLQGESAAYYAAAEDKQAAGTLFAGADFAVIAGKDQRCLIRLGLEDVSSSEYVWVDAAEITGGTASISTAGVLPLAQTLYTLDSQGRPVPDTNTGSMLQGGTVVTILGSYNPDSCGVTSGYIESAWSWLHVDLGDKSGYLPRVGVQYDAALEYTQRKR